mmetsp:Transcript_40557/g.91320  ORF Transcript_40557/g.91320 Transcript_40557/m.91320 type:complete len:151 (+) Transcript_40557:1549-2001(+)
MSSQRWRRTSLRRRPPSSGPARTVARRADYQNVVAEQRATQKILEFALKKLDFHNKKSLLSIAIHRSQAPGEAPPPPPGVGHLREEGCRDRGHGDDQDDYRRRQARRAGSETLVSLRWCWHLVLEWIHLLKLCLRFGKHLCVYAGAGASP